MHAVRLPLRARIGIRLARRRRSRIRNRFPARPLPPPRRHHPRSSGPCMGSADAIDLHRHLLSPAAPTLQIRCIAHSDFLRQQRHRKSLQTASASALAPPCTSSPVSMFLHWPAGRFDGWSRAHPVAQPDVQRGNDRRHARPAQIRHHMFLLRALAPAAAYRPLPRRTTPDVRAAACSAWWTTHSFGKPASMPLHDLFRTASRSSVRSASRRRRHNPRACGCRDRPAANPTVRRPGRCPERPAPLSHQRLRQAVDPPGASTRATKPPAPRQIRATARIRSMKLRSASSNSLFCCVQLVCCLASRTAFSM